MAEHVPSDGSSLAVSFNRDRDCHGDRTGPAVEMPRNVALLGRPEDPVLPTLYEEIRNEVQDFESLAPEFRRIVTTRFRSRGTIGRFSTLSGAHLDRYAPRAERRWQQAIGTLSQSISQTETRPAGQYLLVSLPIHRPLNLAGRN
jgi:hypothetical protein